MPDPSDTPSIAPAPSQMVYAVRGTDRLSGLSVETVVQAADVRAARRVADRKSLEVETLTLMHPLNGAEALKAARANPNDRFNPPEPAGAQAAAPPQNEKPAAPPAPPAAAPQAADFAPAPAPAPAPPTADPAVASEPGPEAHPAPDDPAAAPGNHRPDGQRSLRPTGYGGPAPAEAAPARPRVAGSLSAVVVLAGMGVLLYVTVLRNQPEGVWDRFVATRPDPAAAVASNEPVGPTDVDQLIAASQPPASNPLLPRAQRGPGRTAYRAAAAPAAATAAPAATPSPAAPRAARISPAQPLVLTAVSPKRARPRTAVINGRRLTQGESINGHQVIQILDDSVVLRREGRLIGLGLIPPSEPAGS